MIKIIEDKLEELDTYFAPKKESEKWLLIFVVAALIGYIGYNYLLPYTESIYNKNEKTKKRVKKNISENIEYLNSITVNGNRNFYIKKFDNEMISKKKRIVVLQDKTKFIIGNLEKLSDMLFNKKSWSIFLNSITHKAAVHDISLEYIDNQYTDNNGSFGHVLEIALGATGSYKNIVKFINELEQNTLVTDIFETKLVLDNNSTDIKADIHISVWGVNH
jgi:hypothetical protein